MRSRTKILIVGDHPAVRRSISCGLGRQSHSLIVGEAADGREAVAKAKELLPDIVLLDINPPRLSGLEVAKVLRKALPDIKVLILSMHQPADYLAAILQSGAQGFVLKGAPPEELVKAINTVTADKCYFSPAIISAIRAEGVHSGPLSGLGTGGPKCVIRIPKPEMNPEDTEIPRPEVRAPLKLRKREPSREALFYQSLLMGNGEGAFELGGDNLESEELFYQRVPPRSPAALLQSLNKGSNKVYDPISLEFLGPRSALAAPGGQIQASASLPSPKFFRSLKFTMALLIVVLLALSAAFHIRP